MALSAIRREVGDYIDILPDSELEILKPILMRMSGAKGADSFAPETDLTDEERGIIAAGRKKYAECPESYVSWSEIR